MGLSQSSSFSRQPDPGLDRAGTRVRIGFLAEEGRALAAWEQRLLRRILASARLDPCVIVEIPQCASRPVEGRFQALWLALEARFAARPSMDGLGDAPSALNALPRVCANDVQRIRDLDLDVIIDLTDCFGTGCGTDLARHGVWFTGLTERNFASAGLAATSRPLPVTQISLWRTAADAEKPQQIAAASLNTKFIASRNGLFMAEKSVTLILRELHRLAHDGRPGEMAADPFSPPAPLSAFRFARYLCGLLGEAGKRVAEIGMTRLRLRPGMFVLRTAGGDPRRFDPARMREHEFGDNAYQADPFLWERDGQSYCYFETYDYATGKGHISVGRFEDGGIADVRTAIRADYHLSFPFVFEAEGDLFMLPETCGARRIELWRCVRFPDKWERHRVVMDDVIAADSSIAQIGGQWWLFTNLSEDPFQEMNSELHVFRASGPDLGELEPHPLNPVVFDARTARNGGRILEIDGKSYRPSQDNSHGTYGYGINLLRIDALGLDTYRESLERKIEPTFEKGLIGCHHLDMRGGRIVIDVRKSVGGIPGRRRSGRVSPTRAGHLQRAG